jgi:hypothetical protein
MGGNPVAPLIDMRRQLNLSSRQVAALDSIERTLLQRNRTVMDQMNQRRDSVMRPGRAMTPEERQAMRDAMRARMDSMRPLREQMVRNDSIARSGAMAVLTDSQRIRVREMMAERRGFAAGRAMGRRGPDGPGRFRQMQPRMRGRMMPQGPQRPGFGARQFRGGMGPQRFNDRLGPPAFQRGPDDMAPRMRQRMMPDPSGEFGPGPGRMGMRLRRPFEGPMRDSMNAAPRRPPMSDSLDARPGRPPRPGTSGR